MKKILCIDGGGIKGAFPVSFLAALEDSLQTKVSEYFDLIVGTSTGGIIALGLGLGFSATELLKFYEELGSSVFGGNRILKSLRRFGISKYSQAELRTALEAKFGNALLGNSSKRLVIPSLNLENGEVYIYKTSHNNRLERDFKERVVDVALATAAAPSYFPAHRNAAGLPLVDGGVWANNPIGLAAIEALTILNWPRKSIRILSLGCTTEPLRVGLGRHLPLGISYWGLKIADLIMTAQSSFAMGSAQLLIGHENVYRISPGVQSGRFSIDKIREIPSLKGLGYAEARKALPSLRPIFFGSKAKQFFPVHT